jgi:hypothetical protein
MGNITETSHFEKLQEDSEQMNDTMQEDEKLVYEEQFGNNDKCVICGDDSIYDMSEPINKRIGYIEGSGQMCLDCYDKVYGHEWNRNREQKIRDAEHYSKNGKIINININKLQKKYDNAVKNNIDVFMYDGAEILTSYAKYLLEYLKMEQNNE